MVVLIILMALIGMGLYLETKWEYESIGILLTIVAGFNAFEQTLIDARNNGSEYEAAAILKEISTWNTELSKLKYNNKTILLDEYIDDRIELLEPIR